MVSAFSNLLSLMPPASALIMVTLAFAGAPCSGEPVRPAITAHADGLHGYIHYDTHSGPDKGAYSAGIGFYSAVWALIDQPLDGFQIGPPGCWILPDNSDDKDTPLAPEGTLARTWKERGPTWSSVFQTVEGGLGYWAGNRSRYGGPRLSMSATPSATIMKSVRWTIDRHYMLPPTSGTLVHLDPALIVTPPPGLETGYVSIVVGQRARDSAPISSSRRPHPKVNETQYQKVNPTKKQCAEHED